jgi:hypothetical protein
MIKKIKFLTATAVLAFLTACGGGGGGGQAASLNVGDSITYRLTSGSYVGGTELLNRSTTRYVTAKSNDSSLTLISTSSDQSINGSMLVTPDYLIQSFGTCTYSNPAESSIFGGKDVFVGKLWSTAYVRTCLGSITDTVSITGSVTSEGSYVSSVGTFDAYKANFTVKYSTGLLSSHECWYDKQLHVVLGCAQSTNSNGALTYTTVTLKGIDVNSYSNSYRSAERFAGQWNLSYTGSNSGTCQITSSNVGVISGSCSGGTTLSGVVDRSGDLSINISTGALITGKLNNPLAGNGSWVNSGASGLWTAVHL